MTIFNRLSLIPLLILIIAMTSCEKREQPKEKLQTVIVAPAKKQLVREGATVVGQIVAKKKVFLRARVEGFLEKRNFNEGAFVKKGELLYVIEQALYKAQVTAAEAELTNNEASLKNDTIDYNRQKFLAKNNAVSKRDFDKATADKAMAEAQVMLAKAKLAEEKLDLSYTKIYSPFNGRIGLSRYNVGNLVSPNSDPLAVVVMVNPIRVAFNITESSLVTELQRKYTENRKLTKTGAKGSLDDIVVKLILSNSTEYSETGKIDFIDNVVNSMTGTILLRATFPNPKAILIPGAYVKVKVESKDKIEELLIPQSAIQEDQTGKFVMVVDKDNKVKIQNITAGKIYGIYIVVRKGLKQGERVITEGLQKVREGMSVNPVQKKNESDNDKKAAEKKKSPAELKKNKSKKNNQQPMTKGKDQKPDGGKTKPQQSSKSQKSNNK